MAKTTTAPNKAKKAAITKPEYSEIFPHVLSGLCANSSLISHSTSLGNDAALQRIVDAAQQISMRASGMIEENEGEETEEDLL